MIEEKLEFFDPEEEKLRVFEAVNVTDRTDDGRREYYRQGAPVIHRQMTDYGCGCYSLANLFDDDGFLQKLDKEGDTTSSLNNKLCAVDNNLVLETMFMTSPRITEGRLTDGRLFDMPKQDQKGLFRAMLMILYKFRTGLLHYVVLCNDIDLGDYIVIDSTKTHAQVYALADLLIDNHVVGVEYFRDFNGDPNEEVLFNKSNFQHIFIN